MIQSELDFEALLSQRLEDVDLSTRTANSLKYANVRTLGELAKLSSVEILCWPGVGAKTLTEIQRYLRTVGLTLRDANIGAIAESVVPVPPVSTATAVEDELYRVLTGIETGRNAEILARRFGWLGEAPRTLDSVGQEFAMTRERVRQIEKRAVDRLAKRVWKVPRLEASIQMLRDNVPAPASLLMTQLAERGLSRSEFCLEGLKQAATLFRLPWPFEFATEDDDPILVPVGWKKLYRRAKFTVRKRTSDQGCVSIQRLVSELRMTDLQVPGLRHVLRAEAGFKWLDDSEEWIFASDASRNRLSNLCAKVLGVSGQIHITELRHAVSKSRRLAMCPPKRVLTHFIESTGLGSVSDSVVRVRPGKGESPSPESGEGMMLRVLEAHGPAMDGEEFAEACVMAGVNATTFYVYRAVSPVITALGKNVYCRVGAEIPAGTVEEIIGRRKTTARMSDSGWTPGGQLWYGFELTRQVITGGGIRLTTFVSELVQGDWNVSLPDGTPFGSVTCRESFLWSLRKTFDFLGAEPKDVALLEFDVKRRNLRVRVGGHGLFDYVEKRGQGMEGAESDDP